MFVPNELTANDAPFSTDDSPDEPATLCPMMPCAMALETGCSMASITMRNGFVTNTSSSALRNPAPPSLPADMMPSASVFCTSFATASVCALMDAAVAVMLASNAPVSTAPPSFSSDRLASPAAEFNSSSSLICPAVTSLPDSYWACSSSSYSRAFFAASA